jgi:hypothetical protein
VFMQVSVVLELPGPVTHGSAAGMSSICEHGRN